MLDYGNIVYHYMCAVAYTSGMARALSAIDPNFCLVKHSHCENMIGAFVISMI